MGIEIVDERKYGDFSEYLSIQAWVWNKGILLENPLILYSDNLSPKVAKYDFMENQNLWFLFQQIIQSLETPKLHENALNHIFF